MKNLVIGDVHFGIYSNSIDWLNSQIDLFRNFIFTSIKEYNSEFDNIIFLGDLFDIRYSVNQVVCMKTRKVLIELKQLAFQYNKQIYFIAGNHDYYSPIETNKKYNIYNSILSDLVDYTFNIINEDYCFVNNNLLVPWFITENNQDLLYELIVKNEINAIYCHTDTSKFNNDLNNIIKDKDIKVFSGHIHTNNIDTNPKNLFQLGSLLPMDFNDSNYINKYIKKYIYIINEKDIVTSIENNYSPKFISYTDIELNNIKIEDLDNMFVRLFISNENMFKTKYKEIISKIEKIAKDLKVSVYNVSNLVATEDNHKIINIDNFIEQKIPNKLVEKFESIKKIYNDK